MIKKPILASLLALAAGTAFFLGACSDSPVDEHLPGGGGGAVNATLVGSPEAVVTGVPGSYYIPEDRSKFYLRCPCGRCAKHNVLPLVAGSATWTWQLSGPPGKPSLSPSIHWFETNGTTTHWHGWLRDGVFAE